MVTHFSSCCFWSYLFWSEAQCSLSQLIVFVGNVSYWIISYLKALYVFSSSWTTAFSISRKPSPIKGHNTILLRILLNSSSYISYIRVFWKRVSKIYWKDSNWILQVFECAGSVVADTSQYHYLAAALTACELADQGGSFFFQERGWMGVLHFEANNTPQPLQQSLLQDSAEEDTANS